jgi:hypothetical protein
MIAGQGAGKSNVCTQYAQVTGKDGRAASQGYGHLVSEHLFTYGGEFINLIQDDIDVQFSRNYHIVDLLNRHS